MTQPYRTYEQIHAALRTTSPSAIYDLRRIAMERTAQTALVKWWDIYPEGQMAAAWTRLMRIIGPSPDGWHQIPWEVAGDELP